MKAKKIILSALSVIVILVISFSAWYRFGFLRMPERIIPDAPTSFVSPANGEVIAIHFWHGDSLVVEKELRDAMTTFTGSLGDSGYIVSIMLQINDVHYQRAPINARLVEKKYQPGKFNSAVKHLNRFGIRFENEYNELLFETENGTRFKVIQIAGYVARRIEDFLETGQPVKQGEVIGVIKLGSQVTMVFPHNVNLKIKEGDYVIDGETIIADEIVFEAALTGE